MHHSWDPGGKATNPGQLLHVDIVFIAGKPTSFSVDDITRYIVMARMETKGQADVNKAIDAIVSRYQSSLKVVSVISCDAEAVLKSQATINQSLSELGTIDESLLKHEYIPKPNYYDPTDHLSAPIYRDSTVGDNRVSSHTTHSASDALTPGRIIPTHGEHQQQRIAAADPIVNDNDVPGLKNDDDADIIEQRNNSKPTSVKSILKSPSRTSKQNQEQSPLRRAVM